MAQPVPPRRTPVLTGGPRTAEGRSVSSLNAVKHGLTSRRALLSDEDASEYAAHVAGLHSALCPVGALEEMFTDRIASASWRLRRLTFVEAEAFDRNRKRISPSGEPQEGRGLGEAFMLGCVNGSLWPQLSRYESAISRQLRSDLHELQRLQADRAGQQVRAPSVVDVIVSADPTAAVVADPA